jgi:hypothetical protein
MMFLFASLSMFERTVGKSFAASATEVSALRALIELRVVLA